MSLSSNFFSISLLVLVLSSCTEPTQPLFNGKDLSGWHVDVPAKDSLKDAPSSFIVREGNLVSIGEPRGHLITDKIYKNYRLNIEYRFTKEPGNCGILVHASTPRALYGMFPKSMEVQMEHENAGDFWCIQMDITTEDMILRRGPKNEWGVVEGKARRIKNLTEGSEYALGEWNSMTIECFEDKIKVWVNGDFVNYGYNADETSGQIAIQAEGAEVAFKTLDLTSISKLTD
ncbi:DUF1080 domain-containing protein [Cellulophaga sp. Z1A5H]|uniref:3-keto-disaccharide hydrolase n=1 Tax=Cellulophaga sp. Z1A5H TaxID=2687291 RepID=UPI0013FE1365|nr:DUF1080 domain-containing protein [Cellulophaga sp. Z1A5H]